MNEKRIDTNEAPHVMLQACRRNVIIGSWMRKAVTVTGDAFTSEAPEPNLVTVTGDGDIQVTLPEHSRLTIEDVQGSLTIKNVAGLIKIGQVQEGLALRNVANVQVDVVRGPLDGEGFSGPLTIGEGQQRITLRNTGDVTIRRAQDAVSIRYTNGRIAVEDAAADLTLQTVSGDLSIDRAGANVTLSNLGGQNILPDVQGTLFLAGGLVGGEHSFTAQGDIFVYWPSTAPLNLIATAATITNLLSLRQQAESKQGDLTTLTGFIEDRKTFLILKSSQRIGLTSWDEKGEPAFAESDFDEPPAAIAPGQPDGGEVEVKATIDTAVAQAVTKVINRIDLELGPEWGRRFAALELEDKFTEALIAELAQVRLVPQPEVVAAATPVEDVVSPGTAAFVKAEKKVERSLQQAVDTMDQARQRLATPAADTEQQPAESAEPEATEAVAESGTAEAEEPDAVAEEGTETAATVAEEEPGAMPAPDAAADAPPAQSAAQLRILDMLEKGAISVAEASRLLQSL